MICASLILCLTVNPLEIYHLLGRGEAACTYNSCMPYVAMATVIDSGATSWLTAPRLHGSRTFGTRAVAQTFGTGEETKAAILEMIQGEDCRGLRFSVEAADGNGGVSG